MRHVYFDLMEIVLALVATSFVELQARNFAADQFDSLPNSGPLDIVFIFMPIPVEVKIGLVRIFDEIGKARPFSQPEWDD